MRISSPNPARPVVSAPPSASVEAAIAPHAQVAGRPPAAPGSWRYALGVVTSWVANRIGGLFGGPKPADAPARGPHYAPDNFMLGANLPWVNYGQDFGANAKNPSGGISQPRNATKLDQVLGQLEDQGVHHLRWFMLGDGRSGIRYAPDGTPTGLDSRFFADVDAALAIAKKHHQTITFSLADFLWFQDHDGLNGPQPGRLDLLTDPAKRQALLENVIRPILGRYGQDPTIEAWDVINEPEWVTFGQGSWNPKKSVAPDTMRGYIQAVTDDVHRLTSQQATVGSASTKWLDLVRGLGLDVYQAHWYDSFESSAPVGRPVEQLKLDRPLILGEFPTKGSQKDARTLLDTARQAGYAGAMPWGVLSADTASGYEVAGPAVAQWAQDHDDALAK